MSMIIKKEWAMPSKNTFSIKPIRDFIKWQIAMMGDERIVVDPFANINEIATVTNDIDPSCNTDYNMDALEFLRIFEDNEVDILLFDPPYSPRQVSECYKKVGKTVNMQTTQASFWSNLKVEISRIVKPSGKVICCSWNSGGIGKKYGFEMSEILLVAHGGWHNDTIVTVEYKI